MNVSRLMLVDDDNLENQAILVDLLCPLGFIIKQANDGSEGLESDRRKSREAGCDAFLSKPVRAKELYALLETHLNLTWKYAPPAEVIIPEKVIQEPLIPPPPDELAALHKTALFGDMSEIKERAAHIIALGEQYRPFGEKLQRLARDFEEKKILSLVENFMINDERR